MRSVYSSSPNAMRRINAWLSRQGLLLLCAMIVAGASSAQTMAGKYTVCSSGCDYSTIASAVSDLNSKGVSGAVSIEIQPGSYNESFSVGVITGASSANTITIRGAGTTPGATRVYSSSASTIANLSSSQYVTLRNMKLEYTGSSSSRYGVKLSNTQYCKVDSCVIIMPTSSSDYCIYESSGISDTYTNNILRGGYYCMYLSNYSSSYTYGFDLVKGNRLTQFYYYGYYSNGSYQNTFKSNFIDSNVNFSFGYGVYSNSEGGADYESNILPGHGGMYYGFQIYYPNNYNKTTPFQFVNNMIGSGSTNLGYGMYIYYYGGTGVNMNILHNTIYNTRYYNAYIYNNSGSGYNILNNIFYRTSGGYQTMYLYSLGKGDKVDGNDFYNGGGSTLLTYKGSTYNDITSYKAAAAADNNGTYDQSIAVTFVGKEDLHLDQTVIAPFGIKSGVTTDIDGDPRCVGFPTSGADESGYGKTKPVAKFSGPASVIDGTPVTYLNSATLGQPKLHHWYIDNVWVSDSIHLFTTALRGKSSAVIKLVEEGCAGKDSTTMSVTINLPTTTPTSDFIADQNLVKQGASVKFMDISIGGASTWNWNISPDSSYDMGNKVANWAVVYGNLTSPAIQVKFLYPGKYKVCLTTSNAKGKGTTECKTDYIEVMPSLNIGSQSVVRDARGYIYDNGGPNGNYTYGTQKTLLDPCASTVYLVINKLDFYCGYDYLSVYDSTIEDKSKIIAPLHKASPCNTTNTGYYGFTGFTGGSMYSCSYSCIPTSADTLVAKSGKMLLVQNAKVAYNSAGFEAFWWSTPKTQPKPVAKFTSKDSVCTNASLTFNNQTTGDDVTYMWDLDGDPSTFEYTGSKSTTWAYFFPGKYRIMQIASNCGGSDTFMKNIVVYDPPAPKTAFIADNTNPTTNDVVYFSSSTQQCVDAYTWKFSTSGTGTATFVNGTNKSTASPQLMFSDTGCYNVTLVISNVSGIDSLTKSCYIHVKGAYCIPAVANLIPDVGISEVEFNTIDNKTPQGTQAYNNYTPTVSTTVEIGVKYKLTVERTTNKNKISRAVFIDWNGDGDFDDSQELYAQDNNSSTLSWSTDVTVPSFAKVGATVMRIAVNQGSLTNDACGPNTYGEYEDYRLYIRPDITAPVITLKGSDTIRLEKGSVYNEPGFTAIDNLDGNITSNVIVSSTPSFDNLIEGTYKFAYNVKDAAGNAAVTRIRVVIITPDVSAPDLVVEKPDTIFVAVGKPFNLPKVLRAYDLVDGDLTSLVTINNPVNVSVVDTYTVSYSVTDQENNTATVSRTVIVLDSIAPVIKLVGGATIYQDVNAAYSDSGVTLSDNYYSDAQMRKNLVMQSNVDVSKLGTYTVVYSLVDPSGNKAASVTRTVIVVDKLAPEVTLNGDTSFTLDVYNPFVDPGVSIKDNYDALSRWDTLGTFYQTFPNGTPNKLGSYSVVYKVTDKSGNTTTVSRTINVVDRTAPVITLKGSPTTVMCRWATYQDSGYVVTDNYDKTASIKVTKEGTFVTNNGLLTGLYSFRYKAEDASGNAAYSSYRVILVEQCASGINDPNASENSISIFPNPGSGLFNVAVEGTAKVSLSVSDIMGRTLGVAISQGVGNNYTLDLRGQSAGVYFLSITTGNKTLTKRIVVEK